MNLTEGKAHARIWVASHSPGLTENNRSGAPAAPGSLTTSTSAQGHQLLTGTHLLALHSANTHYSKPIVFVFDFTHKPIVF